MHPCGVLLSDASLLRRTPVVPTSGEGFPMAQFDKEDVEDLGLLKLDVLGVRMQSAMAHAVAEIGAGHGGADRPGRGRRRATRRRTGSSGPPRRSAASRSSRRASGTWWAGCSRPPSTTWSSTSPSSGPARSPPTWCGRSSRPGTAARRSATRIRTWWSRCGTPTGSSSSTSRSSRSSTIMTGCGRGEADRVRRGLSDPESQGRIRVWFAQHAAAGGYGAETIRAHLGDHRGLRLVRLLQGARGRLRRADVPVGVAEGAPPGRLLRRAAHARPRDVPEAAAARGRAAARGAGAAAGREPVGGRSPYRTGV